MAESGVQVEGLTVTYPSGGSYVNALRDVALTVDPSEYVVVVGANGAGKSTLVNAIAGVVPPARGTVRIFGEDAARMSFHRRAQVIARVFQDPASGVFGELSLEDNLVLAMMKGSRPSPLRFARSVQRRKKARELLAEYGRGLERMTGQLAGTLSGGQRQLVALSMAVARTPRVLLLDEHTSALDPEVAITVMERTDAMIREHRLTTVMVTHNMRQAAAFGDRVVIMSRGQIVDEVFAEEKRALGADGLVDRFRATLAEEMTDRMLG